MKDWLIIRLLISVNAVGCDGMAHDVDKFLRDLMEMQLELIELSPKAPWIGLSRSRGPMTKKEYLLIKCAEECTEVAQRCTKALTFGLSEVQVGQQYSNAERVLYEYADLAAVVDMLLDCGALPKELFEDKVEGLGSDWGERVRQKKEAVKKWMEYSKEQGVLQ